jgi:hypothetical protein
MTSDYSRDKPERAIELAPRQGALPAMADLLEVSRRGLQLRMTDLGLAAVGDC